MIIDQLPFVLQCCLTIQNPSLTLHRLVALSKIAFVEMIWPYLQYMGSPTDDSDDSDDSDDIRNDSDDSDDMIKGWCFLEETGAWIFLAKAYRVTGFRLKTTPTTVLIKIVWWY